MRLILLLLLTALTFSSFSYASENTSIDWKQKTDAYWKGQLSQEQYRVCRHEGTEPAFSGKYNDFKEPGTFTCSSCGYPLFHSKQKYDSGTGWPSFWQAINKTHITEHEDNTLWMKRTELKCARCNAHLGHVFPDGPQPTGQRYCINSVCLDFKSDQIKAK